MSSLEDFARRRLAALEARSLRRELKPTLREDGIHVWRGGRRLLSFSCNDYLGLTHHPKVVAAAHAALDTHGAGAGASRLVTGDHPLLAEFEQHLAAFKEAPAACLFGSGYLANMGILATLMSPRDLILVDELVHSCIWSGTELAGSKVLAFRHNDVGHAAELLQTHRVQYMRCTIATEGVFSMDGDRAPVAELAALAKAHDAWLLVDDAHAVGVLDEGRGSTQGLEVPLQMGTLSKAFGSYGGYVCAPQPVVDLLKTRARTLVYSTALPAASVAAAMAALAIVEAEPERVARPLALARQFTGLLGLPEAQSAIVPIVLGEAKRTLAVSAALEEAGFLVGAIRPPTVPAGTSRLRVTFSAAHGEADVAALAEAVRPHLEAGR